MKREDEMVILGAVSAPFGVKGWVKVNSHAEPKENILNYSPWYLFRNGQWQVCELLASQGRANDLIVHLANCEDRDQALELVGCEIAVARSQLPGLKPGEYYWTDLEGLRVENLEGVDLGRIAYLFETGANDVIVTLGDRERLIPYLMGQVIKEIDLEAGLMRVDWDADF